MNRLLNNNFSLPNISAIWQKEFRGYNFKKFQQDLMAGVTVAAVALPLALAFGVASGATAAAGLVTAVLAGVIIGALAGGAFQMSGPTGAMSAVLIVLASRYGLEGMWVAGLMAGVFLVLMGLFNLGQVVHFIPAAVITGFTSGIGLIIFIGQLDNLLGIEGAPADSALGKLLQYARFDFTPNWASVLLGLLVIAIMFLWPEKLNTRFPASLLGILAATGIAAVFSLDLPVIGDIPQTILLEDRLSFSRIPWSDMGALVTPALSIAALGAIESLLCGTVAGRMTGAPLHTNQELVGQGIGNIIIPFFGGVPATAAIARTSVAIRSGAATRVTSIVHSAVLLLAALLLAPVIARVPLAALGGVLAVTAWRMNDWSFIKEMYRRGFRSRLLKFTVTMVATVVLDLTQAIILGLGLAALMFVLESSRVRVTVAPVIKETIEEAGYTMTYDSDRIVVVYVVGPLFFGTVNTFNSVLEQFQGREDVILSMRSVPLLDATGIDALEQLVERMDAKGARVYLSGLTEPVRIDLERAGVIEAMGEDRVFWSAYEAIIAADRHRAEHPHGGHMVRQTR